MSISCRIGLTKMGALMKRSSVVSMVLLALGAVMAHAHHSFAMFDNEKDQVLEGTVKEFQWTNPHIWIQVNVKSADGSLVEYSIEGGSPNQLRRQGWTKDTLRPGDQVVLTMHPLKDGSPGGSFMRGTVNGAPIGGAPAGPPGAPPGARPSGQ
jgi:hypothetical protein